MYRTKFLLNDYPVAAYADAGPPSVDSGFVSGVLPAGWTYTRADSVATDCVYMDGSTVTTYTTFAANQPRLLPFGLLMEPSRTNYFLNSEAPTPGSKTVTLALGTYTMWYLGTATNLIVTAGTAVMIPSTGQATPGVPYTFQVTTAGTVNVAVLTGVLRIQVENGLNATSYILSGATAVTRADDKLVQNFFGGQLNASQGTYWVEYMWAGGNYFPPSASAPFIPARLMTAGIGSYSSNVNTDQLQLGANTTPTNLPSGRNFNATGGADTQPILFSTRLAGNVSRLAMSVSPTRAQMASDYVLGVSANATYRPASLLAVTLAGGGSDSMTFNGYIRGFKYWPVAMPDGELKECTGAGYYSSGPILNFDFTTNVFPRRLTMNRTGASASPTTPTDAQWTDAVGATYNTYPAGNSTSGPRMYPGRGILLEETRVTMVANSNAPITRTTSACTAGLVYVAWMNGTGSVAFTNGTGTIAEIRGANPLVQGALSWFSMATTGTITHTITGTVNRLQIEQLQANCWAVGPSSFVQTGAAASVSSGQDNATMPTGNFYNTEQGTHFVEFTLLAQSNGYCFPMTFASDAANREHVFLNASDTTAPGVVAEGGQSLWTGMNGNIGQNMIPPNMAYGQVIRAAYSYNTVAGQRASAILSVNGVSGTPMVPGADPSLGFPRVYPTQLYLGANPASGRGIFLHRRVAYYDYAMTDAQLSALTDIIQSPALDLSFLGPTLDSRIVFARNSIGTYFDVTGTIQTATANTPRFGYDPVTYAPRGLLIEEARTNLILNSGRLDNVSWSVTNSTVTPTSTTAPDGTTNALTLVPSVAVAQHTIAPVAPQTITAGAVTTYSVFVKPAGYPRIMIVLNNGPFTSGLSVTFDLSAGTAGSIIYLGTGSSGSTQITSVGNGWFRVTLTGIVDATSTSARCYNYVDNGSTNFFAGNGTSGLYLWGAQLEAGSFSTSYIPTTTTTVARALDTVSMPTAPWWFDQTKGSLQAEYMLEGYTPGFGALAAFVGANANNDYINVCQFTTTHATPTVPCVQTVGASAVGGTGLGYAAFTNEIASPANLVHKTATAWTLNTPFTGAHNGVLATDVNVVATALPTITGMVFMGRMHFQNPPNGWMRRIRYYQFAMTADQLQRVTR